MHSKNTIPCPICQTPSDFFSEPVGPFCSDRCKMVDLGKWLNEEYRVSEPLTPQHFEEFEELQGEDLDNPERY